MKKGNTWIKTVFYLCKPEIYLNENPNRTQICTSLLDYVKSLSNRGPSRNHIINNQYLSFQLTPNYSPPLRSK